MYQLKLVVAITILLVNITLAFNFKNTQDSSIVYQINDVNYRLPNSTYPEKYRIDLSWTDDETFIFNGTVTIDIVVRSDTNTIVLHSRNDIQSVTLIPENGIAIDVTYTNSSVTDFLTISCGKLLTAGSRHTLVITYESVLNTNNRGFFRQSYEAENGEKRQY